MNRVLTTEQVRAALTKDNPDYGKDFTDYEWEQITERLCSLARLMWRFSQRQVEEGNPPPEDASSKSDE